MKKGRYEMTIPGAIEVQLETVKSFRIHLDRTMTNGHDFCQLLVDETNCNFTARLYGGETYTYGWLNRTEHFIDTLIEAFKKEKEFGSLYSKLQNRSVTNQVDAGKTGEHLLEILKKAKEELDEDVYDEIEESIESFMAEDYVSPSHFYSMYSEWFGLAVEHDVLSDHPYDEDYIQYAEDFHCRVFCEQVIPILADVLEAHKNALV